MDNTPKQFASILLSLSLFSLAAAIVYFTVEIASVSKQIPDILVRIDNTTEKIEPIVEEISEIVDLVPPILKEVEATRQLIPPILKEVELTRKIIPPILNEVKHTREQIPAVLKESEAIRVAEVAKQVEATRPLIPKVIKEVETTRESIPGMMKQADVLIEKARLAGKEASQGAVTGFFKGIILAPFALVGDAGRSIVGLSDKEAEQLNETDFSLIEQISLELLNDASKGDQRQWQNPDNDTHGSVSLVDVYEKDDFSEAECRSLDIVLYKNNEKMKKASRSFCKDEDGKWDFAE